MNLDAKALEAAKQRIWQHENSDIEDIADYAIRFYLEALPHAGKVSEEMVATGHFLLDRISEIDWSSSVEEIWRDWDGHVEPAIARFRSSLSATYGATNSTKVNQRLECPDCSGQGLMSGYDCDCPTCDGTGKIRHNAGRVE